MGSATPSPPLRENKLLKKEVARGPSGRVLVMDSITKVSLEDEGTIVVSGSHGGASSGEFALEVPLRAAFFNDAGVGKDDAGIAALKMLQDRGVAGGTVSHVSGRIGDSQDMWDHGVVSHVNALARAMGIQPGQSLSKTLTRLTRA
jgi:hypothetical protein